MDEKQSKKLTMSLCVRSANYIYKYFDNCRKKAGTVSELCGYYSKLVILFGRNLALSLGQCNWLFSCLIVNKLYQHIKENVQ
jgi:hypothetical protein